MTCMDSNLFFPSCTEQLWCMTPPLDAPWMHGCLNDADNEMARRAKEAEAKNIELNRCLSQLAMQAHIAREDLANVRAEHKELQQQLEARMKETTELKAELQAKKQELLAVRDELLLLQSKQAKLEDQDLLAVDIWGPGNARKPDATWDPPPVLLYQAKRNRSEDKPLSIGRVAADLGIKHGKEQQRFLAKKVREAFKRARGKSPEPRVFCDSDGAPERIACFSEKDREFLVEIVLQHGEPACARQEVD